MDAFGQGPWGEEHERMLADAAERAKKLDQISPLLAYLLLKRASGKMPAILLPPRPSPFASGESLLAAIQLQTRRCSVLLLTPVAALGRLLSRILGWGASR